MVQNFIETPDIRHSTYSASALNLNQQSIGNAGMDYLNQQAALNQMPGVARRAQALAAKPILGPGNFAGPVQATQENNMTATPRRLVQVFILDADENVPLADCLIYKGELKLTDLTDQELFYEIDIKQLLDAHNEKRVKLVDKKVKERVEHLEPARIRDLRMQIVTVATF